MKHRLVAQHVDAKSKAPDVGRCWKVRKKHTWRGVLNLLPTLPALSEKSQAQRLASSCC